MKLFLVFLLIVPALCSLSFGGSEQAIAQLFGAERAAILRNPERVRVVLLSHSETDDYAEHVTERSKPREASLKLAAPATAALLDDSNYGWGAKTGTTPTFVVRFIFSREAVSFSVDVSASSYIRVHQDAKSVGSEIFRTSHPAIGNLAKSVFPEDKQLKAYWPYDWKTK